MARFAAVRMVLSFMLLAWMMGACTRTVLEEGAGSPETTLSLAMSLKHIGPAHEASTKMATTITQSDGAFRGIEQVYVIPFSSNSNPAVVDPDLDRLGSRNVELDYPFISSTGSTGLVNNNTSRLFKDATIPLGMNAVLVYGKARDLAKADIREKKHTNGSLVPEGLNNPDASDDIYFHLDPILSTDIDGDMDDIIAKSDAILAELNDIVTLMRDSGVSAILGIYDALKHESENQILSCSFAVFDRIRYDIQTALYQRPYDPDAIAKINQINMAVSDFSETLYAVGENFPANYGLPDGALGFWWNGEEFIRLINGVNIGLVDPASYCYPPSLWYYANSSILVSKQNNAQTLYVPSNPTWDDILANYVDGASVNYDTQSVAIVDQLQYGVGMLDLKLNIPGADVIALANGCPLTGIIIGDQKDVDFRFQPAVYPVAPNPSHYIYDTLSGNVKIGESGQSAQTLVLQTTNYTPVYFALEFENTTRTTLYGLQEDILPWCKFYLAGKLNPLGEGVTQPTGETLKSVFCQDHVTTVTVTIQGIMNAYNTVPDLHDPQLEIGILADMKWEPVTPQSITLRL